MNSQLGAYTTRHRADTMPRIPSSSHIPRDRSISFSNQPLLVDNIPEASIQIKSSINFPSNTLLFLNVPQDATLTNSNNFLRILSQFGQLIFIKSIVCSNNIDRVIVAQFLSLNSAILCKSHLNTKELAPGYPCLISFATILNDNYLDSQQAPVAAPPPQLILPHNTENQFLSQFQHAPFVQSASTMPFQQKQQQQQQQTPPVMPVLPKIHISSVPDNNNNSNNGNSGSSNGYSSPPSLATSLTETIHTYRALLEDSFPATAASPLAILIIQNSTNFTSCDEIKFNNLPLNLINQKLLFDTPTLREIRKLIDSNQQKFDNSETNSSAALHELFVDELSLSMNLELIPISSDYLGNTIIQKLITDSSNEINLFISKVLVPYLPNLSIHKNGTWVAQKLINSIKNNDDYKFTIMNLIKTNLKPFIKLLICDTYGNYLVQGILNWIDFSDEENEEIYYHYTMFIWEAILLDFLSIATNRYGSRALRTCLELIENKQSFRKSVNCLHIIVDLIITNILNWSCELCCDQNGSLIITWFLDTCNRYDSLTKYQLLTNNLLLNNEKFINLCGTKLGGLTILKILNLNNKGLTVDELKIFTLIKSQLLNSILDNLSLLINNNNMNLAPNLIYKLLGLNSIDANFKSVLISKCQVILKDMLNNNGNQNLLNFHQINHQLKRLMEECGIKISSRCSSTMSNVWNSSNNGSSNNNNNNNNNNLLNGNGTSLMNAVNNNGSMSRNRSPSILSIGSSNDSNIRSRSNSFNNNINNNNTMQNSPLMDPFLEDQLLSQQLEGLMIQQHQQRQQSNSYLTIPQLHLNSNAHNNNNNNNNNANVNNINDPFHF